MPTHERLAINLLLRVGQKGPPSDLIGLICLICVFLGRLQQFRKKLAKTYGKNDHSDREEAESGPRDIEVLAASQGTIQKLNGQN